MPSVGLLLFFFYNALTVCGHVDDGARGGEEKRWRLFYLIKKTDSDMQSFYAMRVMMLVVDDDMQSNGSTRHGVCVRVGSDSCHRVAITCSFAILSNSVHQIHSKF